VDSDRYGQAQLKHGLQTIIEQVGKLSQLIDRIGRLRSYETKTFGRNTRIVDVEASADRKSQPSHSDKPAAWHPG
jgi:hypothetical protein